MVTIGWDSIHAIDTSIQLDLRQLVTCYQVRIRSNRTVSGRSRDRWDDG